MPKTYSGQVVPEYRTGTLASANWFVQSKLHAVKTLKPVIIVNIAGNICDFKQKKSCEVRESSSLLNIISFCFSRLRITVCWHRENVTYFGLCKTRMEARLREIKNGIMKISVACAVDCGGASFSDSLE